MTPEERAEQLVYEIDEVFGTWKPGIVVRVSTMIEAAIHAAVNEALERAAVVADYYETDAGDEIAADIRALIRDVEHAGIWITRAERDHISKEGP